MYLVLSRRSDPSTAARTSAGAPLTRGVPSSIASFPSAVNLKPTLVANTMVSRLPAEGFAEQFFVHVRAIDLRRVEERDAKFERPRQRPEILLFVTRPVSGTHAHAAQALNAHNQPLTAKPDLSHSCSP